MVTQYLDALRPEIPEGDAVTHEGGSAFAADHWTRLRRFLILGSEWSFYQPGRELTIEHVGVVNVCLADDPVRTVGEIEIVSDSGRAPKNEPAILALAIASVHADKRSRAAAYRALPNVCRTGTHVLHFAAYHEALGGGWGRGMRNAIGGWFLDKRPQDLAYQAIKYQSRDGWALRDLLRLAKPNPRSVGDDWRSLDQMLRWIVKREYDTDTTLDRDATRMLFGYTCLQNTTDPYEAGKLIVEYRLPREAVPTTLLNSEYVWRALLDDMPMTAMIRNLGKMSAVGLLGQGGDAHDLVINRLGDDEKLQKARVHPLAILVALKVYEQGHGDKGSLTWTPSRRIINALNEAFYLSFGNVESTGKRIMLALDVSGSMAWGKIAGMPLSPREASAALALVTTAVEPNATIVAYANRMVNVNIRPSMRLDEVVRILDAIPYGGTYCSLPFQHARGATIPVDGFVSYTDSETWDHNLQSELVAYRQSSGINASSTVVGMMANEFTLANPKDPRQLDVAGFDLATPNVIAEFVAGRV